MKPAVGGRPCMALGGRDGERVGIGSGLGG
jgi:hypothetical protein